MTDETRLSMARALVVSGLILYIPANILPVMTITITGQVEPLTIMGGVLELYDSGLTPVAAVVFLASIVVPFLKLAVMSWILLLHGTSELRERRTMMYRILHQIGSWSMIDISSFPCWPPWASSASWPASRLSREACFLPPCCCARSSRRTSITLH